MHLPVRPIVAALHIGLGCLIAESACASFETTISVESNAFHGTNVLGE